MAALQIGPRRKLDGPRIFKPQPEASVARLTSEGGEVSATLTVLWRNVAPAESIPQ
jgi:hypothetical protein